MRLRNIPGAEQAVCASPYVVTEPAAYAGQWREYFGSPESLSIEIGMGKGRFLLEMADLHPQTAYVGIEQYTSVLLRAVEHTQGDEKGLKGNLRFVCADARQMADIFAEGEVDRIYLNFSDPWPKQRHAKRRLTAPGFLRLYSRILSYGGTVEFKTDNQDLFDFSLESARSEGWKILAQTRDLHHDPMGEDNVMTEYEEKFSSQGSPICKMIITPGDGA